MDRNLGASKVAESVDDHGAYGWLYQWGRVTDGHEQRFSPTGVAQSPGDDPGHGKFIILSVDWRETKNDSLWQGVAGTNNPCPAGFRVPTEAEWQDEIDTWRPLANDTGAFDSPLRLLTAGYRGYFDGIVREEATGGYYASSTGQVGQRTSTVGITLGGVTWWDDPRAEGNSVRCIMD